MTATLTTRSNADRNITVSDVVDAARKVGASTEAVAVTLRRELNLTTLPISHALGIDAAPVLREPDKAATREETNRIWAEVRTDNRAVTVPDVGDDWRGRASCRNHDPALWYCDDELCDAQVEAVAICTDCPVIGECAIVGLFEQHGLWGGITPRGRRELRKYLRVGVVATTPAAVGPLVAAMATSSLHARMTSTAQTSVAAPKYTPDGRLFFVPPVEHHAARAARRPARQRRPHAVIDSLFG